MTGTGGEERARVAPLTAVLPLKRMRVLLLRFVFWQLSGRRHRRGDFETLDKLKFVSALRWSLVPRLERPSRLRLLWPFARLRDEERWHALFETSYHGDWDDYLDSFASATPRSLARLFGQGVGFPGLSDVKRFKGYAVERDLSPEHYASAYPSFSANDIRAELEARFGDVAAQTIARGGYGRTAPLWSTFLVPLDADRVDGARRAVRALGDTSGSVLLRAGYVHFARAGVLEWPTGASLLITMTHDCDIEPILERIVALDVDGCLRALVAHAREVPDDDDVVAFLLRSRPAPRPHLAYCRYAGYPATYLAALATGDARRHDEWPRQLTEDPA